MQASRQMPPFNNQNSTGDNFDTLTKSQVPVSIPRRSRRLRKSWMRCATLVAQVFLHLRYGLHLKVSVLRPKHPPRLAAEERSYQEASKRTVDFAFIQTVGKVLPSIRRPQLCCHPCGVFVHVP